VLREWFKDRVELIVGVPNLQPPAVIIGLYVALGSLVHLPVTAFDRVYHGVLIIETTLPVFSSQ
jgi:hypothetical protein